MLLLLDVKFSRDLKGRCVGLVAGDRISLLNGAFSGGEELRDVSSTFPVLPPAPFLLALDLIPSTKTNDSLGTEAIKLQC